mmetsp:Transcript_30389/g.94557  ORF Transcript_30389/g.94557 Transcript_30389/m.94557 type:complete len:207 (-) Transcript_30389:13-633(-)
MGGSGSCCGGERMLELPHADRCVHCCGEQQCRVDCTVRKVILWRRRRRAMPAFFALNQLLCVEIAPVGVSGQTKRTEAGRKQPEHEGEPGNIARAEESWVWCTVPAESGTETGRLAFQVPLSGQLALSVLESQSVPWLGSGGLLAPELLGEARIRVGEDILPVTDSNEALSAVDSSGELSMPLVLDGRICGNVELVASLRCEDLSS